MWLAMTPLPYEELLAAMNTVVKELWQNAYPVEEEAEVHSVAMISCNGDLEVADALTEACLAVGKDGTVVIEEGNSLGIEIDFKEGFELNCGAVSSHFLDGIERKLVSPLVAIVPKVITSMKDVYSMLEESSQFPNNELLLICYGLEGEALKFMATNHVKGVCKSMPINIAGVSLRRAEYMKDIAALCGCEVLEEGQYDSRSLIRNGLGRVWRSLFKTRKRSSPPLTNPKKVSKSVVVSCKPKWEILADYDRDNILNLKTERWLLLVSVGGVTESAMKEKAESKMLWGSSECLAF